MCEAVGWVCVGVVMRGWCVRRSGSVEEGGRGSGVMRAGGGCQVPGG